MAFARLVCRLPVLECREVWYLFSVWGVWEREAWLWDRPI